MKTGYAHEAEAPMLANWPDCKPEIDWHLYRVIVELEEGDEVYPEAMTHLVDRYGADNINIMAFANAGCEPRLRIVAYLERDA